MTSAISSMLFATDLSHGATHAQRYAVEMAKATGARIHILHVCEELTSDAKDTLLAYVQDEGLQRDLLSRRVELAKKALQKTQDAFWDSLPAEDHAIRDRVSSVDVVEGYAADAVLRQAKDKGCDMIVLGAHEKGRDYTFLGTVARRILRRAEVPTLVVPFRDEP